MQPPVGETTKRAVIEDYLRGKNRDSIANDLRIGTGTVSKIIKELKIGVDYPTADDLRELALGLRKLGISASRYAEGARIASLLVELGFNDEELLLFVSGIYSSCKKMDLQPDKVAYLLKLLHDIPESVPPIQFQEYIELQKSQIERSKEEIERLQETILNQKSNLDTALKEEVTTRGELKQFSSLKTVMEKNGVTMTDNSRFVEAVDGAKKLGYDPHLIVEKVSNLMKLEIDQKGLEERVKSLNAEIEALESKCRILEQEELSHSYTISIYRELEKMGMGIKQLKLLRNTVTEIATANNIPQDKATEKFFSDVQKHYDDISGFELELQNSKSKVQESERMLLELNDKATKLNSIILKQSDQIQQLSGFEFVPLVRAASGQQVPKNELAAALIKAIDLYLINSDANRFSTKQLQNSRRLLTNEIEGYPNNFQ